MRDRDDRPKPRSPEAGAEASPRRDEAPGYDEVRALMASDALTRMARSLKTISPDASAEAADAVTEGVTRFHAKRAAGTDVERPDNWIYVAPPPPEHPPANKKSRKRA